MERIPVGYAGLCGDTLLADGGAGSPLLSPALSVAVAAQGSRPSSFEWQNQTNFGGFRQAGVTAALVALLLGVPCCRSGTLGASRAAGTAL